MAFRSSATPPFSSSGETVRHYSVKIATTGPATKLPRQSTARIKPAHLPGQLPSSAPRHQGRQKAIDCQVRVAPVVGKFKQPICETSRDAAAAGQRARCTPCPRAVKPLPLGRGAIPPQRLTVRRGIAVVRAARRSTRLAGGAPLPRSVPRWQVRSRSSQASATAPPRAGARVGQDKGR